MLAQISIEFITLVSILIVILSLTIYYNSSFYLQMNSAKIYSDAQTLSDQVASEINLALKAGNGYSRIFYIPKEILNAIDYNISVENYRVILNWATGSTHSIILVEDVIGDLIKGQNLIKNLDGRIYVNQ